MVLKKLTDEELISALSRISVPALSESFGRPRAYLDRMINARKATGSTFPKPVRMPKVKREKFIKKMLADPTKLTAWINKVVEEDRNNASSNTPENVVNNLVESDLPEESDVSIEEEVQEEINNMVSPSQVPVSTSLDGDFTVDVEPVMDSELAKQVPEKKYLDVYKHRKVYGFEDFNLYDKCRARGDSILVEGPTGSGKTMSFWAYAHKNNLPVLSVNCHGMTTSEAIIGTWQPSSEGFTWKDGIATKGIKVPSVIIIEEINMSDETLSSIWYSLLDGRRNIVLDTKDGAVIDIHPETLIVATMNPNYAGTHPLNQALRNRFSHKLEYGYDKRIEKSLIRKFHNQELINAYYNVITGIREAKKRDELETDVSTRDIVKFMEQVDAYNVETAYTNFINAFEGEERDIVKQVSSACDLTSYL